MCVAVHMKMSVCFNVAVVYMIMCVAAACERGVFKVSCKMCGDINCSVRIFWFIVDIDAFHDLSSVVDCLVIIQ